MLRKSKEKWYNMELKELRCSRCGCEITTHEYIHNCQLFVVIGVNGVVYFCDKCVEIVNNRDE